MVKMIKAERMKQMDEIEMNNAEEDLKFVEWKEELNKELRSFWKAMTK
jgi:hypothetical protein